MALAAEHAGLLDDASTGGRLNGRLSASPGCRARWSSAGY